MNKLRKYDFIIVILLLIFIGGFTGIAEFIKRAYDPFPGMLDSLFIKVIGFFLFFVGILWIWWTSHLLKSLAFGAKLKVYAPLTFARNPYYAAVLYAFYPACALILGRFEVLLASVALILIGHLFLFRLPQILDAKVLKTKGKAGVRETIITNRVDTVRKTLAQDSVVTPCKYMLKYGKTSNFVEIFTYIFVLAFSIDFFVNPISELMSGNCQLVLGIIFFVITLGWLIWTLWALSQKSTSPYFRNDGPYGFCRHPLISMFLFGIYPLLVIVFNSGELLFGFPFLLTSAHMITREEEYYYFKIFGEKWLRYTESHPRFFPYFQANHPDAGRKRREFAMSSLIFSGSLFLAFIIVFAIIISGLFATNHESYVIVSMPILLVISAIMMFPAWEYRKRVCTILAIIMTVFFLIFLYHIQVSRTIYKEINTFFAEVQNPESKKWMEFLSNNVYEKDGVTRIQVREIFVNEYRNTLHNLRVGSNREIYNYRQISFIFPIIDEKYAVQLMLKLDDEVNKPAKAQVPEMSSEEKPKVNVFSQKYLTLYLTLNRERYSDWRDSIGLPEFRIKSIIIED
ncbi:MAG: hypothetical protein K8S87_01300 [Planctomycetes bacterium]|nr:hypothetical protein [Planctomycetota bacterium]